MISEQELVEKFQEEILGRLIDYSEQLDHVRSLSMGALKSGEYSRSDVEEIVLLHRKRGELQGIYDLCQKLIPGESNSINLDKSKKDNREEMERLEKTIVYFLLKGMPGKTKSPEYLSKLAKEILQEQNE